MTRAYVRPTASRVLASTVGMLPASVLAAACWVACARSGGRAWLIAATTTAAAAACVFAIPS